MFTHAKPYWIKRAAALMVAGAVVACDQPTQPLMEDGALDGAFQLHTDANFATLANCSGSPLGGSKFIDLTVNLFSGQPAAGVAVAVISPVGGVACAGATGGDGRIVFQGVAPGAAVLLAVQDELSVNAFNLQIVPPNPVAAALLADAPSDPSNRQHPALLAGSTCNVFQPLTWASYVQLKDTPCIVPPNGLTRTVQLTGNAPTIATLVLNASNQPLTGVIVAALSPANTSSSDLATVCAVLPWIDQAECVNNSNGPALLQSLGLTDSDGRITLGVSFGSALPAQPVVIETIAEQGGLTLFGTLIQTTSGEQTLQTSPGMCNVKVVTDSSQPSGVAQLDIIGSAHSVGLTTSVAPGAPLDAPSLVPVLSTLIVKVRIDATIVGGTGMFTEQYRLSSGGIRTVRASFEIGAGQPDVCTVSAGSGNGLGSGGNDPQFVGYCAPNASTPSDMEPGRRSYTLFFVLSGMDAARLVSAEYDIRTDDTLDPSRAVAEYSRGAVTFTGLKPDSCPVRLTNDGRWVTL